MALVAKSTGGWIRCLLQYQRYTVGLPKKNQLALTSIMRVGGHLKFNVCFSSF